MLSQWYAVNQWFPRLTVLHIKAIICITLMSHLPKLMGCAGVMGLNDPPLLPRKPPPATPPRPRSMRGGPRLNELPVMRLSW
ncbi:hypothetical protein GOODEAATRI_003865 [Goodea atripinnis]|uniref:Uncharacterized protein n=1 Tax=Goodea atripinnis TaxID=208336 RepID=A0ABV0NRP1_9TELE